MQAHSLDVSPLAQNAVGTACQISGAVGGGSVGAASEAVHPMFTFLLETPATTALPALFLDPDSLPTHEALLPSLLSSPSSLSFRH